MPQSIEDRLASLEGDNRRLHAIASAQEFVIEILLTNFMSTLEPEDRQAFAADVIRVGGKTDGLRAASDAEAEALADIAVQSEERIRALVTKAMGRVRSG